MFDSSFPHSEPFAQFSPEPPPERSRRALVLALAAAGAIVLIIAAVWAVSVFAVGPSSQKPPQTGGKTPEEAVRLYFDALAQDNPEKALALGLDHPVSKEFLTADVLKRQQDLAKVSGTRITGTTPGNQPDVVNVSVSVAFGDAVSEDVLVVRKTPEGWKLAHSTVTLQPSAPTGGGRALEFLTLFGKPAGNVKAIDVFPGTLEVGSINKNIELVPERDKELLGQLYQGSDPNWLINGQISQIGHDAVVQAMQAKLEACEQSSDLAGQGCPNKLNNAQASPGTARWTETENYADQDPDIAVDFATMTAKVTVTLHWTFAVQLVGGGNGNGQFPTEPRDFTGSADLARDPLEVVF
ncbi:MAG: tat pathway signal sequence [Segniliparus sp.]|uniref:tat pathway signal sequence n=1 Tax=Segniliparus sp. TaxID=2804064 RepID=UPI003F35AD8B